ncbi:MAG: DHA2 family efflux MFS transporter permease subunit [Rhodospirillales bacterium]|nr:DHA2 family efflux MFS transporter permease subunit [Rhodospirillales bacterium]
MNEQANFDPANLTPGQRTAILLTLTTVTMLYAMTVTIANVALPRMQGSLSATQDQIAWVVTFNIVATAAATPLAGWLAARMGRRHLMISAIVLFAIASLMCGTANSVEELVFYRIIQGASGAPLVPMSQAIVVDTYPKEQHGSATAFFGVGVMLGPIIAPTLGGYITEAYSWRWVFYMILPFTLVSLLGVLAFIRDRNKPSKIRLDWTGFIALAVAIASFQLMLDRGERNDWFSSTEIILEAVVSTVALYIFVVHSLTADKPFLRPVMLTDRNYAIGLLIVLVFGMLNFTPITILPSLLQQLRGYPDSVIGWVLSARGIGTLLGFMIMAVAGKIDPRYPLTLGFLLQVIAGYSMWQFDINLTIIDVVWTTFLQGLGVGLMWVPLSIITFSTLNPVYVPDGMALFHLLRNIGSSIHISLSIALVIHTTRVNYAIMTERVTPYNRNFQIPSVAGIWNTESVQGLAAISKEISRQATMIGYLNSFAFFAATAVVAMPLVLLIKKRKA